MKIRAVQYLFSNCLYQQAIFKGMNSVFLSVLTATHFYYFATVFSGPRRPNNRMQVFGRVGLLFLIWKLVYFYIQSYTVSVAFLWSPGSLSIPLWPLTSTTCLCPHSLLDLLISGTILCKYLIWLLMKIQVDQQLRHQQRLKSIWSSLAGGQDGIAQWLHMVAASIPL